MTIELDEIELSGIDEHPVTDSVKLHGPPGSGKTTESGGRVGRLIRDYDYDVSDVAWVTYRRSLAYDTLNRLESWDLIPETELDNPSKGATRYINTTHAVANRCAGDLPDPVRWYDRKDFCDRRGLDFETDRPWEDSAGKLLFRVFDWMKNNRLNPGERDDVHRCPLISDLRDEWQGSVPDAWYDWQDYKAQEGIIDFYEMLERPLRNGAHPGRDILVVDEYHDATPLIAELCEQWMQQAETVIVAGDPHQVVTAFDGADPRFFERVDLPRILLDTTYRVPEEHWQLGTSMLSHAHDPPAVSRRGRGLIREYESPQFAYDGSTGWTLPDPTQDAAPVKLAESRPENAEMLFLARTQLQAQAIARALDRGGVIYGTQKDMDGWNTSSQNDRRHLYNALQKLSAHTRGDFDTSGGLSRFASADKSPEKTELSPEEATAILRYAHASTLAQSRSDTTDLVAKIQGNRDHPTAAELHEWVEPAFWDRYTAGPASVDRLNKGGLDDLDRAALRKALDRYDEPITPGQFDVEVLTIHASKGKEADDVVLYDGVTRRIRREMEASARNRENEWRTWYVGCTRASKRLHVMRDAFDWTGSILPDNLREVVLRNTPASGGSATGD